MPLGDLTILVSVEGDLLVFGANGSGQLGLGHERVQKEPATVAWKGPKVLQVDWGNEHSLVLDVEGGVWESGSSSVNSVFHRIEGLPFITQVAAGYDHSAALDRSGALWVWTLNTGLSWATPTPKRLECVSVFSKVACGRQFLVAEAKEGLWVLGDNSKGQLGLGNSTPASVLTLLKVPGRAMGPLRCLAALCYGILFIDEKGEVFTAGDPSDGRLGRTGSSNEFQKIVGIPPMMVASCGYRHSLTQDQSGGTWAWGFGGDGRLGTGTTTNQHTPTLIPSLQGAIALVAGASHSLGILPDGRLLVFGHKSNTGLKGDVDILTPTLSPLRPALPHPAQFSIWHWAKEVSESQKSWLEVPPQITHEKIQQHREDLKAGLVNGSTPAANWGYLHSKVWKHQQALQLEQLCHEDTLTQQESVVSRLVKDLEEAQTLVCRLKEELQQASTSVLVTNEAKEAGTKTLTFLATLEPLLKGASEVESTTNEQMQAKMCPFLPDQLTVDDLGFALNHFGVANPRSIAQTLEKEVSMSLLGDVTENLLEEFGVLEMMERQRILLSLHMLSNGLLLDSHHTDACGLCQNQTPEETVAYLGECEIAIPKDRVLELKILVGHLMLMGSATLCKTFGIDTKSAILIHNRLTRAKEEHLNIQASPSVPISE